MELNIPTESAAEFFADVRRSRFARRAVAAVKSGQSAKTLRNAFRMGVNNKKQSTVPDAVVRVAIYRANDLECQHGTGILVAGKWVLTAKHVVQQEEKDPSTQGKRIMPHASGVVRQNSSGAEVAFSDPIRHPQLDLALLPLDRELEFQPLIWLRGRLPDGGLPEGAQFRGWGYPQEKGGNELCDIVLPNVKPAHGAGADGEMYRIQLDKTLDFGFSGGPVILELGGEKACSGIARLGGDGVATSTLVGAGAVLEFLRSNGIEPSCVDIRAVIDRCASTDATRGDIMGTLSQDNTSAQKHGPLAILAVVTLGLVALVTVLIIGNQLIVLKNTSVPFEPPTRKPAPSEPQLEPAPVANNRTNAKESASASPRSVIPTSRSDSPTGQPSNHLVLTTVPKSNEISISRPSDPALQDPAQRILSQTNSVPIEVVPGSTSLVSTVSVSPSNTAAAPRPEAPAPPAPAVQRYDQSAVLLTLFGKVPDQDNGTCYNALRDLIEKTCPQLTVERVSNADASVLSEVDSAKQFVRREKVHGLIAFSVEAIEREPASGPYYGAQVDTLKLEARCRLTLVNALQEYSIWSIPLIQRRSFATGRAPRNADADLVLEAVKSLSTNSDFASRIRLLTSTAPSHR